jgi:hypothetical protein
MTGEGIRIGSTYSEVIATYGGPGENGYNEVVPYPKGSREYLRDDRYYVNYDALGCLLPLRWALTGLPPSACSSRGVERAKS